MKTKITSILTAALLASGAIVPLAAAQGNSTTVTTQSTTTVTTGGNATSTAAQNNNNATTSMSATTTVTVPTPRATGNANANAAATSTRAGNGKVTAEAHRSEVATVVQSLLSVANREGGIGSEVRVVAQSQMDSASTTASAMTKVETRGKLKIFFIGSDYRSLGQLRSEMVVTQNNIDTLTRLMNEASASAKAELAAQIQVLEGSRADIEAFVETHEGAFSLFGWLVKLFVR